MIVLFSIIAIIFFFLGASIGSFFCVLVERSYEGKDFIASRSECTTCHHVLGFFDLIPVISYFFLQGKCRYCKIHIPAKLVITEALCGILYITSFLASLKFLTISYSGFLLYLGFVLLTNSLFFYIALYDFFYFIIQDAIVVVGSITYIVVLLSVIVLQSHGYTFFVYPNLAMFFVSHLMSAVVLFVLFLCIYLITKGNGIGGGDVKLVFLIGLILGPTGSIISLYISFFAGALVSIYLLLRKTKGVKDAIAFGPFLAFGIIMTILYKDAILQLPLFNFISYLPVLF